MSLVPTLSLGACANGTWVLGAPEILLAASDTGSDDDLHGRIEKEASQGRRVVLLATTRTALEDPAVLDAAAPPPSALRPVAMVRLSDEVRSDAAETLAYFAEQGVQVKVISGDSATTVGAIASSV